MGGIEIATKQNQVRLLVAQGLYVHVSGIKPFRQVLTESTPHSRIMKARYVKMVGGQWDEVSNLAKDLISSWAIASP